MEQRERGAVGEALPVHIRARHMTDQYALRCRLRAIEQRQVADLRLIPRLGNERRKRVIVHKLPSGVAVLRDKCRRLINAHVRGMV